MSKNRIVNKHVYHVLDPTTPWFEWLSYCECCASLNIEPRLGRFMRYREYLREVGIL